MTMNPVTEAKRCADGLDECLRYWIRMGLEAEVPLSRIASLFDVPVVTVRNVLIADQDELPDHLWEYYDMQL